MHPYRCQVCGEVYLGDTLPDRCPFCGAIGTELKKAALWYDRGQVKMSEQSSLNLKKALELELINVSFYKCASDKASNHISQGIFKRLAKQELEHAELICKALGMSLPDPSAPQCMQTDSENFIEAHLHEDMAINFYLQAAAEATNTGEAEVAYIFRHLSEIETQHLLLTNNYR